jgi:bifunctional DNase/RNase
VHAKSKTLAAADEIVLAECEPRSSSFYRRTLAVSFFGRGVPDYYAQRRMREMTLYGVSFEPIGKQPIVLLKTVDEDRFLPIWIGQAEAAAILMRLQGSSPQRPMTHDLLSDVVSELKGEVVKVTVTELRENTYFARITIVHDGNELEIDSRPSDAIALAVRCDAQIFAADDVVEESGIEFQAGDEETSLVTASNLADLDPEEFRQFIETVTPEEFASSLEELGELEEMGDLEETEDEEDDEA